VYSEQNRFQHRAGRALAVGAGYSEKHCRARPSEHVAHFRDAFQPELDGFRMDALDVVEPLSEAPAGHERRTGVSLPRGLAAAGV